MRKSNKAKRADKLNVRHAKEVTYNHEIKERPATWSARMPAYCYTELCPDPALRTRRDGVLCRVQGRLQWTVRMDPRKGGGKEKPGC